MTAMIGFVRAGGFCGDKDNTRSHRAECVPCATASSGGYLMGKSTFGGEDRPFDLLSQREIKVDGKTKLVGNHII